MYGSFSASFMHRWKKSFLETCFICEAKYISWSKMTPSVITVEQEAKVMATKVAIQLDGSFLSVLGPSMITSGLF